MAAGAAAIPASAAPPTPPLPACADTVTAAHLSPGQSAVGYSVTQGSTVESFGVKVLGVMRSGIAPGRDLILVDTSGPAIDEAGGIWYGISGSPVYTLGGRLIGSISYGFSSSSSIAGVTPADPDMLEVLNESHSSRAVRRLPAKVPLTRRARERIARAEGADVAAVGTDLSRLEVPVTISGLTAARRARLRVQAMHDRLPFFIPEAAGSSAAAKAPFGAVSPGDSFAAVISYGDITLAGIGTTTYVCHGKALAFGHPFFFTGPAVLGASAATTFGIVQDPVFGPYKLAAVTDPLGEVDRDRLPGIRARLGRRTPTVPITQDTTATDTGRSRRNAETDVVPGANAGFEGSVPFLAWIHSASNIDAVFDQVSGGGASIAWTVRGVKGRSGKRWSLSRANKWVSTRDISVTSTTELFSDLVALSRQRLARIAFRSVDIRVKVSARIERLALRRVLWSTDGSHYRRARHLRVEPGQRLLAHARLRSSGGGVRKASFAFRIPRRGARVALATVGGPGSGRSEDPFCALARACGGGPKAKSFDALLAKLRHEPRNDDLVGELDAGRRTQTVVHHEPEVVQGRAAVLLSIGGRHRGHRHHHAGTLPAPSP